MRIFCKVRKYHVRRFHRRFTGSSRDILRLAGKAEHSGIEQLAVSDQIQFFEGVRDRVKLETTYLQERFQLARANIIEVAFEVVSAHVVVLENNGFKM